MSQTTASSQPTEKRRRRPVNLYLDQETVDAARNVARHSGTSLSLLIEALLARAIARRKARA